MLILCGLVNPLISFNSFSANSLFSRYIIITSGKIENLGCSFPKIILSFCQSRTFSAMLNNSNNNGHFCLGLTFYGNAFDISPVSMLLVSARFSLSH